ncbi:hypothetical protein EDD18DRAFT_1107518 [Armillaria luteobubalina]|uniref:Uncharacterized protein n=1 Tax=Armillaria luteobubalina TaxID=153913 RepID=A0AA39UUZ2_9AGAR|nr:hypothetical protein EDD18DRAFT_1107518 [Armillaria luteobubalina]
MDKGSRSAIQCIHIIDGYAIIGQSCILPGQTDYCQHVSEHLDTFRKWVGVATLCGLKGDIVLEELQAEALYYGLSTEDIDEKEERLALVLHIFKLHCEEFADLYHPWQQTLEILISTTRQQPKLSKEVLSALIDLSEAIHRMVSKIETSQSHFLNALLLPYLDHNHSYTHSGTATAIAEAVEPWPQSIMDIITALQEYYHKKGMVIAQSLDRSDPWLPQVATMRVFQLLILSFTNTEAEPFFKFLVQNKA